MGTELGSRVAKSKWGRGHCREVIVTGSEECGKISVQRRLFGQAKVRAVLSILAEFGETTGGHEV